MSFEAYEYFHWSARVALIIGFAVTGHFVVRGVGFVTEWIINPSTAPGRATKGLFARRHPKIATVASLSASSCTFVIYFLAFGLILREFDVSLTAYLATASVVGLAVAFGAQGLVQDVVSGLTLVFADLFDIGDMVEVSGQVGRVESVGLRFTQIRNFHGQSIFIPNRMISAVGRFRSDAVRAYFDFAVPAGVSDGEMTRIVDGIAKSVHAQFAAICVTDPEVFGVRTAAEGWRYLRVRFRLWPGQGAAVENVFRQRVLAELKKRDDAYQDWMAAVTYRVE